MSAITRVMLSSGLMDVFESGQIPLSEAVLSSYITTIMCRSHTLVMVGPVL